MASREKNYLEAFENKNGERIGDDILKYFSDLFSLEMPMGRMMKMMPGMVKYAVKGKEYRENLLKFMPQMVPMIKKAISKEDEKEELIRGEQ